MSTPTRGRCLIINNRHFDDPTVPDQEELGDRDGSEQDAINMSNVFKRFSFVCDKIHKDLSAQVSHCTYECIGRPSYIWPSCE